MAISTYSILKNTFYNWDVARKNFEENIGYRCLDAEIRLNWECNAKCKMCGLSGYINGSDKKRRVKLTLDAIKNTIVDLKKMGCNQLTLSGGEPTLSPNLIEIISFATKNDIQVALNTNGYLLNKEYIYKLIESGLKIFTFSVDSPIEKQHDEIRGLKGCYKNIVNSIDIINDYNEKSNNKVYVLINCVLLKENIGDIHKFTEFYEKHPFRHINLSPASLATEWDQWTTQNENLRTSVEDIQNFKEEVFPILQNYNWPIQISDPYEEGKENILKNIHSKYSYVPSECYIPFLHVVIQSNGDVIPCCYADDRFLMGNVNEDSLVEIWNNNKYRVFREKAKNCKQIDMCQSCRQYMKINDQIKQRMKEKCEV